MTYTFALSPYFDGEAISAALAGGVLLGFSVMFKTSVLSGVMGISNYTRRMAFNWEPKRLFFIAGLIVGGIIMKHTYGACEPIPHPALDRDQRGRLFARYAVGSFLVGIGATMQHGCTSGHGLTGLARLSLRSWVAVPVFMMAGVATASISQSLADTFPPHRPTEVGLPKPLAGWVVTICEGVFLAVVAVVFKVLGGRGNAKLTIACMCVGEFVVGLSFASGLVISGMARPSKVAAFLDVASGGWDLSLAFVMGGALCVTFPYFQGLERLKFQEKAFLREPNVLKFDLPPVKSKMPDAQLVLGAIVFGVGWGTAGMCPGPIWVNVGANPSGEVFTALAGLLLGIGFWVVVEQVRARHNAPRNADPATEPPEEPSGMPTVTSEAWNEKK